MKILRVIWLLLNLLVITVIVCLTILIIGGFDPQKNITGKIARLWGKGMLWLNGIHWKLEGIDKLSPSGKYVFVCNHESAADIPIAIASLPFNIVFLTKKELFRIPLFGWSMLVGGMIKVDRQHKKKAKASVDYAIEQVQKRNISIIVFPEGTRSETGELLPFKKGSFILAIRTGLPLVPVTIIGARNVLSKASITPNPGMTTIHIDEPIPTANLDENDHDELLTQAREIIQMRKQSANG